MATRIHESCEINFPIDKVWALVRPLNFAFLRNVLSVEAEDLSESLVGSVRTINYADGTKQKIKLIELSDISYYVTYELIESVPAIQVMSAVHTIKLRRISEKNSTFLEFTSDYSRDATEAVLYDSKYKKLDFFAELRAYLDVTNKLYYRYETLRNIYNRKPTEIDAKAVPNLSAFIKANEDLLNTEKTPIENFHPLLQQRYPSAHVCYNNPLRFDINVQQIDSLTKEITYRTKQIYDNIAKIEEGKHTWNSTVQPIVNIEHKFAALKSSLTFLSHVSDNKAIRDASSEADKVLSAFDIECETREDIYLAVKAFTQTQEYKAIPEGTERHRYIKFLLRDFARKGLHLEKERREKIRNLQKEISALSIEYHKNLGEENTRFEFAENELKGLPVDNLHRLKKTAEGKYIVTLKYPDYIPCMKYVSVEATRRKLEKAYNSRCKESNAPILEKVLKLRAENAALLGYKTHASYILEIRMAKNPEVVMEFLTDLSKKLDPLAQRDRDALLALKEAEKKSNNEEFDGKLHIFDIPYYSRVREEKEFALDHQLIKQYFPLDVVTQGLLHIYQSLLGLKFVEEKKNVHLWHPDVKLFYVHDAATNHFIGQFYLDLHPRDGKYGHAACFGLVDSYVEDGKRAIPVAAMVANFTRPTAEEPSLLMHQEVVTYFHEFGHVMHHLCSEAEMGRFAGTNVERDFVEAPSQMLENWCYEKEPLMQMSGHVKDAKKLPDQLLENIIASKNANAGLLNKRQLVFGIFDQTIHTRSESNTAEIIAKIQKEVYGVEATPETNFAASFGHLVGGYDATYYGYMYAEVYSMDMFYTRFKKEGISNPKVGMEYRKQILSRGGSEDASILLKKFLGREPNADAFLKSKGL